MLYLRVSTTGQGRDGDSLEDQENICRRKAESSNLEVAKVFKEQYSGRKQNRPQFNNLINYLKKHPKEIDCVIIKMIDRFSRGGSYGYEDLKKQLAKFDVKLVDAYGVIQESINTLEHLGVKYDWSTISQSSVAEHVMAENAKFEATNILTRTIGQQITLVRDGYHVGKCDDGFMSKKTIFGSKKKTIRVIDPERAPYYKKMFEMRAANTFTDQEIVDTINYMGFKTKIRNRWSKEDSTIINSVGNKPLTVKRLQEVIARPVYCGVNFHKWTDYKPIKSHSDALVDIDTFNKANRGKIFIVKKENDEYGILYNYYPEKQAHRRNKNNADFPLKNFILCPLCNKPFKGSSPRGKSGKRFPIYHCDRGHKYYGIKKQSFEDNFNQLLNNIEMRAKFSKHFDLFIIDAWRTKKEDLDQTSCAISRNLTDLKNQQSLVIDQLTRTNNDLIRIKLEEKIENLEKEILEANSQIEQIDLKEKEIKEFIEYSRMLVEHLNDLFNFTENPKQKQALASLVFDNFPNYDQIVSGTPDLTLIFDKKQSEKETKSYLARDVGIEPTPSLLERDILPLY